MNQSQLKQYRLAQIEELLWAHPEGLRPARVAEYLNLSPATLSRYMAQDDLSKSIYVEDDGVLKVDRDADLMRAKFSLHEIIALHMATRLLTTHLDRANPHAASALRKLGIALQRFDQNVSDHLLRSADLMDVTAVRRDENYLAVLQTLTVGWSDGRLVRITHEREDGIAREYLLATYFIEPYSPGHSAYVIGRREPPGELRTLKIERIRSAELTREPYAVPDGFDVCALLEDAWGIWYTGAQPVEVVLRFHPRVARRVRENRWHRSQQIEAQGDGSALWRAWIAEPREMLPWVRGWGADCEVLAPEWLRQELTAEAVRLAQLYEVTI